MCSKYITVPAQTCDPQRYLQSAAVTLLCGRCIKHASQVDNRRSKSIITATNQRMRGSGPWQPFPGYGLEYEWPYWPTLGCVSR